jgi:hypothetical protein
MENTAARKLKQVSDGYLTVKESPGKRFITEYLFPAGKLKVAGNNK